MNDEIVWMPGHELADRIRERDISPTEAVTAVLERLEEVEPAINAFVTVTADAALAGAKVAERALLDPKADLGPLHGVPITVKDLCDTAGVRTTYGSKSFADHVPERDAVTWSRLKAAGAHPDRQDHDTGVRHARGHRQPADRTNQHPVGDDPHLGWLQRWGGGIRRVRRCALRVGVRRWRVDPRTGGVLRRCRAEGIDGTFPGADALGVRRDRRPADAQRPRRSPADVCGRRPGRPGSTVLAVDVG